MKNRASSYLKQMITVLTSMAKSKTHALKSKTNALRTRIIIFSLLQRNSNFFTVSSINHKLQSLVHHHDHPEPKHEVLAFDDNGEEANGYESSSEASVVLHSNNNAMTHEPVPDPEHTQLLDYEYAYELHQNQDQQEEKYTDQNQVLDYVYAYEIHQKDQDQDQDQDHVRVQVQNQDQQEEKYPDLTHTQVLEDHVQVQDQNQDQEKYPDLTHSLFGTEDGELALEGSVIELVKNSKQQEGGEFRLEDEIDQVADLFIKRFHHQMKLQKQQSLKRYQERLQSST